MNEGRTTTGWKLARVLGVAAGLTVLSAASGQGNDLLAQAKAAGVLRVGNSQGSPPWNFLNERNQPDGYDMDVAREMAARMGIPRVEFVAMRFPDLIPGVQAGKIDMAIAGQTVTEERKKVVDFTVPYQVNGLAVFVSASNSTVKGLADLAGKRVAVTAGSTQERFVRERVPTAQLLTYETATLALSDVAFGRADAAVYSKYVGSYLAKKNRLGVKPAPESLGVEINAMSFRKGETALKAAADRAFTSMLNDGTLTLISRKWLGLDMAAELKNLPK